MQQSKLIYTGQRNRGRGGQGTGFTGSGYIYKIAPRVGINAPGYELRYDSAY